MLYGLYSPLSPFVHLSTRIFRLETPRLIMSYPFQLTEFIWVSSTWAFHHRPLGCGTFLKWHSPTCPYTVSFICILRALLARPRALSAALTSGRSFRSATSLINCSSPRRATPFLPRRGHLRPPVCYRQRLAAEVPRTGAQRSACSQKAGLAICELPRFVRVF